MSALRVLYIEDDLADAMLLQHAVHDAGADDIDLEVVRTLHEARHKLGRKTYDLVVLDLRLPDSADPSDTVKTAQKHAGDTPLVVLTGSAGVDAETVGPDIQLLDKNKFFHGTGTTKNLRLVQHLRAASEGGQDTLLV